MVDKKRALKDLCDLHYAFGLFSGRWEEEIKMDMASEEYLATMILFAEEYNIKYDKDLSNYIEDENYEPECYTMMYMADSIYEKVQEALLAILGVYDIKEIGQEIAQTLIDYYEDECCEETLDKECYEAVADIKADIYEEATKYLNQKNFKLKY